MQFGGEERGGPQTHELAEDMTEWESVENANRVKGAFVFEIFLHFLLNGSETGEDVAVSVDDAFGISRGTGGKDDLESVVGCEVVDGGGLLSGECGGEVFEWEERRGGWEESEFGGVAEDVFGADFANDPVDEIERAGEIDRDGDDAAQEATEECGDPFGAVVTPEKDAVAFSDGAADELGGETAREGGELGVGDAMLTNAARGDDGDVARVIVEIGDEGGEIGARGQVLKDF
jgi:hypothetical protein